MFEPVVSYSGRVGGEVKSGTSNSGTAWASFSLAVQAKDKDENGNLVNGPTTWIRVSAFKQLAQHAAQSLGKGDRVMVTGRQRSRSYEKDGVTQQTLEMLADDIGGSFMFDAWAKQATGGGQAGGFESYGGFTQPAQPQGQQQAGWGAQDDEPPF